MKKRFQMIKKLYAAVVLLVLVVLIVLGISSASYLNQSYKRGVVRNREEEAVRFTSNYLSLTAEQSSYAQRIITYREDKNDSLSCKIDVRNYIPGSDNLINEYTITYTLQVTLINATSGAVYSVNDQSKAADNEGNCSFTLENQKLLGRSRKENAYTIVFYKADLNEMSIVVTAVPENIAYTGNQFLAANIYPCTKSEIQPFSCVGRFADQTSQNLPSAFDAYNYEIILSNGCARVTLTWDSNLYELDPFFLLKLAQEDIVENSKDDGRLVFCMDQTKGNDSYRIPFYKKNKDQCNALSWEQMNDKISISAEEIPPQMTNN